MNDDKAAAFCLWLGQQVVAQRALMNRLPLLPECQASDPDDIDYGYQTWTPEDQYREFIGSR